MMGRTLYLGLPLSDPSSPDYKPGTGWPTELDEAMQIIDDFASSTGSPGSFTSPVTISPPSGVPLSITAPGASTGIEITAITGIEVSCSGADGRKNIEAFDADTTLTDSSGSANSTTCAALGAHLAGSDVTGDLAIGLSIQAENSGASGEAAEVTGLRIVPCSSSVAAALLQTGIHIQDQATNEQAATNAALLIDDQTAGATVYAIKTGAGPISFGDKIGFFGAAPLSKPTVTGSKGGNAALASLLTALAAYGLITDSST